MTAPGYPVYMATQHDAIESRILSDIRKYGWHVVNVMSDEHAPSWSYTVGLEQSYGHPELAVFDLPHAVAQPVLNVAASFIQKQGRAYRDHGRYNDILDGYDVIVRNAADPWLGYFFSRAACLRPDAQFRMFQLFWPRRDGLFPWSIDTFSGQPLLYEDERATARVECFMDALGVSRDA
jgi:hypothetical protein